MGTDCEGTKFCNTDGACVECLVNDHCAVEICMAQRCVPSTCSDTVKNGTETDIDCGGSVCNPCLDYKICSVNADCTSKVCLQSMKICDAPTCTDTVLNGQETDVDCGGPSCAKRCSDGEACRFHSDCLSSVCKGQLCVKPSCTDAVMNGNETGMDCGGACGECL